MREIKHSKGYILVSMPNHPYSSHQGYIPEHRILLENEIGRYINPLLEVAHHTDGNVTNNELTNLELLTKLEHRRIHSGWKKINGTWWKTCSGCGRFMEVEDNFYRRHKGHNEFVTRCKDCVKKLSRLAYKERTTTIKVVCAWCGKDMGEKDGEGVSGITHSICPVCYKEITGGDPSEDDK